MNRRPLDPQIAGVLSLLPRVDIAQRTPDLARSGLLAMSVPGHADEDGVPRADLRVADVPVREYKGTTGRTIVFAHGGGWVCGSVDTHDRLCATLCSATGATVISVDYRLAPEAPFPAGLTDLLAVVLDVVSRQGASSVALAGDSAGANLAASASQALRDLGHHLRAVLLLYPATDLRGSYLEPSARYPSRAENGEGYFLSAEGMQWFLEHYAAGASADDPRMSPLLGDASGLPPHVVATADYDLLRDEGLAYSRTLAAAGVPVLAFTGSGLVHGFFGFTQACFAAAAETEQVLTAFRGLLYDD